jgi:tetratricopeptide (TPR) repeat protein
VSPRVRIAAIVAAAAATAIVVVVGAAVLQSSSDDGSDSLVLRATQRPEGAPPLFLDLGVREDEQAQSLRRAGTLLEDGRREEAARLFGRLDSLDAEVGLAIAGWPDGTLARLERLARQHPGSAFVRLELGLAHFWHGQRDAAQAAWREARRVEPDSLSAVRAGDLLHPSFPRGLPTFVPSFAPPKALAGLSSEQQLDRLRSDAVRGGVREKLLYGVALQRLGRPLSARKQYDAAVRLAPEAAEPQVAAAVVRFDKARPARAFARLGPLSTRFPRSPSVRFHLGLLLLWLGQVDDARRQLEQVRSIAPSHPLAREAERFLDRLASVGTS